MLVSGRKPILVIHASQADKILPEMEQLGLMQAKGDRSGGTRIGREIEVKFKSIVKLYFSGCQHDRC